MGVIGLPLSRLISAEKIGKVSRVPRGGRPLELCLWVPWSLRIGEQIPIMKLNTYRAIMVKLRFITPLRPRGSILCSRKLTIREFRITSPY